MGRFSNLKDKLADAKDSVHIKILEAQLDTEKKKEEKFEKNKKELDSQLRYLRKECGTFYILMDERNQWLSQRNR